MWDVVHIILWMRGIYATDVIEYGRMAPKTIPKQSASVPADLLRDAAAALDLTPKEAAVYIAVLSLRTPTVQAIALRARTERTGTYDVLERLDRRGLLKFNRVGKRTTIVTEPPRRIRDQLAMQLTAAESVLPRLQTLYDATVDNFSSDRGAGVAALELLSRALVTHPGVSVQLLIGAVSAADIDGFGQSPTPLTPLLLARKTRVLVAQSITPTTTAWVRKLQGQLPCRWLPSPALLATSQYVFGEVVVTVGVEGADIVAVQLTSPTHAQHESAVFDALWRTAKVIDGFHQVG